ncbi:MAG: alanine racemase [Spirochaetales bacterium]|nr:alanine racemase [Spirochaetales bacterium]
MRATHAVIRLDNLRHNIRALRELLRPGVKICMAVKADAYGHGAVAVSKAVLSEGIESLGVATVEEGVELRAAGMTAPILLLGLFFPEEAEAVVENDITPFAADARGIESLDRAAGRAGKRAPVHLKVDTGMGRIGCRPEEAAALAALVRDSRRLRLEGLATHFPAADTADGTFTAEQVRVLDDLRSAIKGLGIDLPYVHAANSGALIDKPDSHFNLVRPGIMLYGYYPSAEQERTIPLKPVMELKTRISFLKKVPAGAGISYGLTYTAPRDTFIATLPVGYGDGYSRLLSNRGRVLVGGKPCPIAGRVCMDQTMIDLGPETQAKPGDEAVLFGDVSGGPDAEEIARLMGTIPYEVTCLITKRVPRIYVDE